MLYVCIVHNIKPCQTQLILKCVLLEKMCVNHPKILTFEKSRSLFVWFDKFPWVCYSFWEDKTYSLPCILFGYKNVGKSLQKPYQTWKTVKTFKKHQNVLTRTHKKRQILFHRFVGEYTFFLPIPSFF